MNQAHIDALQDAIDDAADQGNRTKVMRLIEIRNAVRRMMEDSA
jgi:hypothetical protein